MNVLRTYLDGTFAMYGPIAHNEAPRSPALAGRGIPAKTNKKPTTPIILEISKSSTTFGRYFKQNGYFPLDSSLGII
jgi:hypothetical protein